MSSEEEQHVERMWGCESERQVQLQSRLAVAIRGGLRCADWTALVNPLRLHGMLIHRPGRGIFLAAKMDDFSLKFW
jgi:hypothetical protein